MAMASIPFTNGMENAVFPIEIITEIFKHLDLGILGIDRFNLFRMALVCKAFLAVARPHIFKTISLSPGYKEAGVHRLAQMFRDQPKLAILVQELRYNSDIDKVEAIPHNGDLEVLFKLPNVRKLTICRGYFTHETGACYYHFSKDSLSALGIGDVPMHPILRSRTLKYLRLWICRAEKVASPPPGMRYSLTKFSGDHSTGISFMTIARCSDLVDLHLTSPLVLPTTQALVEMCRANPQARPFGRLEKADFERLPKWDTFFDAVESLGITAFPSLQHLNVIYPLERERTRFIPPENPDRFLQHTPTLKTLLWKGELPKCTLQVVSSHLLSLVLDLQYLDSANDELSSCVEAVSQFQLSALKTLSIILTHAVCLKTAGEPERIQRAVSAIRLLTEIVADHECTRFPALEDVSLSVSLRQEPHRANIHWVHSHIVSELQPAFDRLEKNTRIRYKLKLEVD